MESNISDQVVSHQLWGYLKKDLEETQHTHCKIHTTEVKCDSYSKKNTQLFKTSPLPKTLQATATTPRFLLPDPFTEDLEPHDQQHVVYQGKENRYSISSSTGCKFQMFKLSFLFPGQPYEDTFVCFIFSKIK